MPKASRYRTLISLTVIGIALAVTPARSFAAEDSAAKPAAAPSSPGLYVKVVLANPVKLSKLKTGDVVEGSLARDVYSGDTKLFPAGNHVSLTVDHLEKRKRERNDHWPWVINVFTPRHESFPVFKTAVVSKAEGESSLQVAMISQTRLREVHAQGKTKKPAAPTAEEHGAVNASAPRGKKAPTPTIVLEAFSIDNAPLSSASTAPAETARENGPDTIPAGTQCKILLLGNVSASKSNPGDTVQARLLEPVLLNSTVVLPAGSMVEGQVVKKVPPRWLSRAGSLYLTFTQVTLPEGTHLPITATLATAELDQRSHTRIDSEGGLRGEHPGKAWMAINLGVTAGIAKEADDTLQLIIELIVSTATDTSTAGVGRIAASVASGIYMVTRHGRDVVIPRFTEMAISFDRPVSLHLTAASAGATAAAASSGK